MNSVFSKLRSWASDRIRTTGLYWRFRHLVHRDVWQGYLDDADAERRAFYARFVGQHGCRTVFEFGSGPGPNFHAIAREHPGCRFLGFDISAAAVEMGSAHATGPEMEFVDELTVPVMQRFLTGTDQTRFDLGIYDRVLYLLDERQVGEHFELYGPYMERVVVDDFHHTGDKRFTSGQYYSKDYEALMKRAGFVLRGNEPSEHSLAGDDGFFAGAARRLVFERSSRSDPA